jgi:hypothetical protein
MKGIEIKRDMEEGVRCKELRRKLSISLSYIWIDRMDITSPNELTQLACWNIAFYMQKSNSNLRHPTYSLYG